RPARRRPSFPTRRSSDLPQSRLVRIPNPESRIPASKQHDIELFLQVLLVGLEADRLAEELLQLRHRRRFLVGDAADDLRRGDHRSEEHTSELPSREKLVC